jgi:hypothetical protein
VEASRQMTSNMIRNAEVRLQECAAYKLSSLSPLGVAADEARDVTKQVGLLCGRDDVSTFVSPAKPGRWAQTTLLESTITNRDNEVS